MDIISLMIVVIKEVIITKIMSLVSAMFHLIYFPLKQKKALRLVLILLNEVK